MRASREPRSNGSGTQPIGEAPSARASGYRLLADSQLEEMHLASIRVMRNVYARIHTAEEVKAALDAL